MKDDTSSYLLISLGIDNSRQLMGQMDRQTRPLIEMQKRILKRDSFYFICIFILLWFQHQLEMYIFIENIHGPTIRNIDRCGLMWQALPKVAPPVLYTCVYGGVEQICKGLHLRCLHVSRLQSHLGHFRSKFLSRIAVSPGSGPFNI